ncbi:hypothetical protein Vadar_004611 [Vaccinium darrowii]|uniref:Uncharacterized protein n=1 Tax=Vaccinium darrowii TaxID=229202 RepID=A0ACB7XXL5_9ERIC|nr:hypothetical protein Vadar_004611 [Vaccinium darrowii]
MGSCVVGGSGIIRKKPLSSYCYFEAAWIPSFFTSHFRKDSALGVLLLQRWTMLIGADASLLPLFFFYPCCNGDGSVSSTVSTPWKYTRIGFSGWHRTVLLFQWRGLESWYDSLDYGSSCNKKFGSKFWLAWRSNSKGELMQNSSTYATIPEDLRPNAKSFFFSSFKIKGAFRGGKKEMQESMHQNLDFIIATAPTWDSFVLTEVLSDEFGVGANAEIVDREDKSSLLLLVKAFDYFLAVVEGFCNL